MENLQSTLQNILSDPHQMEQIMAMANALGLQPPDSSPGQPPGEVPPPSPPPEQAAGGGPDPNLLRLMGQLNNLHGPEEQVFHALRQVMSPAGQRKIDQALQAARLSRLAGTLFKKEDGRV